MRMSLTDRINVSIAVPLSLLGLVASVTLLVQGKHTGLAVATLVLGVCGLVGATAFVVDRRRAPENDHAPVYPPRGW